MTQEKSIVDQSYNKNKRKSDNNNDGEPSTKRIRGGGSNDNKTINNPCRRYNHNGKHDWKDCIYNPNSKNYKPNAAPRRYNGGGRGSGCSGGRGGGRGGHPGGRGNGGYKGRGSGHRGYGCDNTNQQNQNQNAQCYNQNQMPNNNQNCHCMPMGANYVGPSVGGTGSSTSGQCTGEESHHFDMIGNDGIVSNVRYDGTNRGSPADIMHGPPGHWRSN